MKKYKTAWWSIRLQRDWQAEENDECHTIYHPQGVGALQISSYRKDKPISEQDILDFVELDDEAKQHLKSNQLGKFKGFRLTSNDGSTYWDQYWVADGDLLLFATYNCDLEDKGTESESIEKMISTVTKIKDRTSGFRLSLRSA